MWDQWLRRRGVLLCCDHWDVILTKTKSLPFKGRILIRECVVRAPSKQDSHTDLWQQKLPGCHELYIQKLFSFRGMPGKGGRKTVQVMLCAVIYKHCTFRNAFFSVWAPALHTGVHGTLCGHGLLLPHPETSPPAWSRHPMVYNQQQSLLWVTSQKWLFSSLFSALEEFSASRAEVSFISKMKA